MSVTVKILISLAIGAIAATIISVIMTGGMLQPVLLLGCMAATLCSALVGTVGTTASAGIERQKPQKHQSDNSRKAASSAPAGAGTADGDREYGTVKWFNVSKGFGFIVRENGEEIFVHFRSIRGKGRRGLRDGQTVSYIVVENDKGPQAEDVATESAAQS